MPNFRYKDLEKPMLTEVPDIGNLRNTGILSSMHICYSINP